jgi:5'(3')-deoxyribonucleotidase
MENKPNTIIIDFDNTIVNLSKAFCETYNQMYSTHKDFKYVDWHDVQEYDIGLYCPLENNKWNIMDNPRLYSNLEFINYNTKLIVDELCKRYNIVICTLIHNRNVGIKAEWIIKHLPFVKEVMYLHQQDKSMVNMSGCAFIDDKPSNLDNCNAESKFIFGEVFEYNRMCSYPRLYDWDDVAKVFL